METPEITKESKEELRKEWVATLRSGEYKQGKCALNRNGKFCCLGVVCDLVNKKYPGLMKVGLNASTDRVCYDGNATSLPDICVKLLGVKGSLGDYVAAVSKTKNEPRCLTNDNDSGKTFKKIADTIENKPKGLFVD